MTVAQDGLQHIDSSSAKRLLRAGSSQVLRYLRLIAFAGSIFGYGIFANLVFLLSALVIPCNPKLAWEINSWTAGTLWRYMQWIFERHHGGMITFSGDEILTGESAIVISNHLSYSDYYLLQSLAVRKSLLPYCRYFAKSSLKYLVPIFGLSMYLVGMIMVDRNWTKDEGSIKRAFGRIKDKEGGEKSVWVVSYLEGTRRSEVKLEESKKFCESRGKPVLRNVLFPRTKGFVAAVNELRDSHVKTVLDLTLVYDGPKGFQVPISLTEVHMSPRISPPWRFHVHVRKFLISSLPTSEVELQSWAEKVWKEKDDLLEGMKKEWTDAKIIKDAGGARRDGFWPRTRGKTT